MARNILLHHLQNTDTKKKAMSIRRWKRNYVVNTLYQGFLNYGFVHFNALCVFEIGLWKSFLLIFFVMVVFKTVMKLLLKFA